MGNRMLVVGDIHGAARTFKRLLDVIGLDRTDELYLLGDYIDRLDGSRGVIETILQLLKDGFQIRPVLGNHEVKMLLAIRSCVFEELLDWLELGGYATLKSYGVQHPQDIPYEHLRLLEGLPLMRVTDDFVFVHAGISSLDDPLTIRGRHHMLWDRSGVVDVAKLGGRRVVSGHTPRKLTDIKNSLTGDHMRIDNGVYMVKSPGFGSLVAIDLGNSEVFVQPNIDMAPADHDY